MVETLIAEADAKTIGDHSIGPTENATGNLIGVVAIRCQLGLMPGLGSMRGQVGAFSMRPPTSPRSIPLVWL